MISWRFFYCVYLHGLLILVLGKRQISIFGSVFVSTNKWYAGKYKGDERMTSVALADSFMNLDLVNWYYVGLNNNINHDVDQGLATFSIVAAIWMSVFITSNTGRSFERNV